MPAAVSYCIGPEEQRRVTATVIAEAANMPALLEAEATLHARGVTVLPDFVANSATNAWWWWTLFGDVSADPGEAEPWCEVQCAGSHRTCWTAARQGLPHRTVKLPKASSTAI